MIVDFKIPELGPGVKEGVIAAWRKEVGDAIEADEVILEVMTEKVNIEVQCDFAGTVTEILSQKDEVIKVGQTVARISEARAVATA